MLRLKSTFLPGRAGNSTAGGSLRWRHRRPPTVHDQGRTTESHDLLTSVYGWFTEGFDTADLKVAKALLSELS